MTHPAMPLSDFAESAGRAAEVAERAAARARSEARQRQIHRAVECASMGARQCLPFALILAHVDTWTGYPTVDAITAGHYTDVTPCAVTWLGDGAWLTHRGNQSVNDVNTWELLWPCPCGGYRIATFERPTPDEVTSLVATVQADITTGAPCRHDCTPTGPTPETPETPDE